MKHYATSIWIGSGKDGNGEVTTESYVLDRTEFTFNSRFANGKGSNPEELLAAAHACCFNMKLSFVLGEAGFAPGTLETICYVYFENGLISGSQLLVKAKVPRITQEGFDACIKEATECSPLGQALNVKITVEATLKY
jgi:osmotically inducible protein OsmC